jgi:hypothetical protein
MRVILRYSQFLKTYKTRGYRLKHLKDYKKLFPINSDPRLAGIVADLIGDGHLQGDPKWRIDFTSNNTSELKRFEKEIKFLFNVNGKTRRCTSNKYKTYNLAINSSPIARILYLCGVPAGQKVLTPFEIPKWIKKDKECFRRFCQRLFSCEGNIDCYKDREIPQIRIEMWKSKKIINDGESFMKDINIYMKKYFNINSLVKVQKKENIRRDGVITKPVRLYIFKDSVINFYKEVGFEGNKQESLKVLLNI